MSFLWPATLFFLFLVPLLALFYLWILRRRRLQVRSYSSLGLRPRERAGEQGLGPMEFQRHIPPLVFMAGFVLLILALARPEAVLSLPRTEGKVILAFDVSGSMAATDLEPNRMEAAKAAARTFVDNQPPGVLIGIVAFSDSGFAVQVPTDDRETIYATMERLQPERGTALANGILAALNTLVSQERPEPLQFSDLTPAPTQTPTPVPVGTYVPAAIVLLTDGENTMDPNPLAAAQEAAERGIRIYTVGIGSAEGTTLEIEGFMVHTQLDEARLQQISSLTDGEYFNAETTADLVTIYENLEPELVLRSEKMEVTSLFAGAGLLALLVGGALSVLWFSRLP